MNDNKPTKAIGKMSSKKFYSTVVLVIISTILFFIFYAALVISSTFLLYHSLKLGIIFIEANFHLVTFLMGLGMIFFGVMIFIFVIKFLFASTNVSTQNNIEIFKEDYPKFFEFIKSVSKETKTSLPKSVFLSSEVNASVHFKSSFWNIIFPAKKNLVIGLGLVNTLNVSELESVIAHEFGHFSQKSIILGNYTYTINRIIYDMAYEEDNWDTTIMKLSSLEGILSLFVSLTLFLSTSINSLMKLAYNLINTNYSKLSRELEYQADIVAASITGSKILVNALRKIQFSSYVFENTLQILNELAIEKKVSENIYENHKYLLKELAEKFKLIDQDGNLIINDDFVKNNYFTSRIYIKDQWASHPSIEVKIEQKISCICQLSIRKILIHLGYYLKNHKLSR